MKSVWTDKDLSDAGIANLDESGITPKQARKCGIYSVGDAKAEVADEFPSRPALVFPYFDFDRDPMLFTRDGQTRQFLRLRFLDRPKRSFSSTKRQRYIQFRGSGTAPYLAPCLDWKKIAEDVEIPIIFTEGEKKALAACLHRYPTIGLGGVNNFMERVLFNER